MGRYHDPVRGRRLDDLRSPLGDRMVFPPSWAHGEPAGADSFDDGPSTLTCRYCNNPRHDGLEALSPHVREQMIASLERNGDPNGLLLAYRRFLAAHPTETRLAAA